MVGISSRHLLKQIYFFLLKSIQFYWFIWFFLLFFSFYLGFTTQSESIACIHGLRVFSMFWTILVHTYLQLFAISENRVSYIWNKKAMPHIYITHSIGLYTKKAIRKEIDFFLNWHFLIQKRKWQLSNGIHTFIFQVKMFYWILCDAFSCSFGMFAVFRLNFQWINDFCFYYSTANVSQREHSRFNLLEMHPIRLTHFSS